MSDLGLICDCGFEFAGPGELRNCEGFVTSRGFSGVECPDCGQQYIDGYQVDIKHAMEGDHES